MTSSQHGLYAWGHTCYNGRYKGCKPVRGANRKNRPQFRLRSATRPHEGGIASNRGSARRGEYVPGPCTHRPSHHESLLYLKSPNQPARRQAPTVWPVIGVKSKQGSRRGTCGWITSFLRE